MKKFNLINYFICLLKTFSYSDLTIGIISGHNFESKNDDDPFTTVLYCTHCGYKSKPGPYKNIFEKMLDLF